MQAINPLMKTSENQSTQEIHRNDALLKEASHPGPPAAAMLKLFFLAHAHSMTAAKVEQCPLLLCSADALLFDAKNPMVQACCVLCRGVCQGWPINSGPQDHTGHHHQPR